MALTAISTVLLVAFGIFFFLKLQTIANYAKYPPNTDCASIQSMFNHNYTDPVFMNYAK